MRYLKIDEDKIEKKLRTLLKTFSRSGKLTIDTNDMYTLTKKEAAKYPRPKILFTENAYRKMCALVDNFHLEVAWHGVVERQGDTYKILDILVYPQKASAAFVESDDDNYEPWLNSLDDAQYNNIRFQGHSHVNFGCSPSQQDTDYYDKLTKHINSYYIFFILNKRKEMWCELHDFKNNLLFDAKDITVEVESLGFDYDSWAKVILEMQVQLPKPKFNQALRDNSDYLKAGIDYPKGYGRY